MAALSCSAAAILLDGHAHYLSSPDPIWGWCETMWSTALSIHVDNNHLASAKSCRIEKHLQCEKLLELARGNTKKHGNKKSGECITPIRYNVLHMYITSSFPCYLVHGCSNLSHWW